MKTQKFEKILVLNKKTVANLNQDEMKELKAGGHVGNDNTVSARTICGGCKLGSQ